jgi:hypothetical protein
MHWGKNQRPTNSSKLCHPTAVLHAVFFASVLMKKGTAETNTYAKEKIVNKT